MIKEVAELEHLQKYIPFETQERYDGTPAKTRS